MAKKRIWNFSVPTALDDAVIGVVEAGKYKSKAEFIREAVRRLLTNT